MTRLLFIFLFALLLVSCGDDNMTFTIGSKNLDVKSNIRCVDTLTVRSYTVMMDSIRTSGLAENPAVVVGSYTDPEFGHITASSYFRVTLPISRNLPAGAVYDSIQLFLVGNQYYTGDSTQSFTIQVQRLKNALKPNDDGYFYNTTNIECFSQLLGSATFDPRPIRGDTTWIRLNDALGQELFTLFKNKDEKVDNNTNFLNYFKGIKLSPGPSNETILGFQFPSSSNSEDALTPTMRLYYHYYQFENKTDHFDFSVSSSDYLSQFNNFTLDNPVVNFPTDQKVKIPAGEYGNRSYVMAGLGIVTRFEIPYLKNLHGYHDNIKIIDAVLQLEPIKNTYKTYGLPEKISLYTSDSQNRFINAILNNKGTTQYADLRIDRVDQIETWYTFNITGYLESEMNDLSDEAPALLLSVPPDDLYKSLQRFVLGSQTNATNKLKLKVFFIYYE